MNKFHVRKIRSGPCVLRNMLIIKPWLIEIENNIHDLAKVSLQTLSSYISGKL